MKEFCWRLGALLVLLGYCGLSVAQSPTPQATPAPRRVHANRDYSLHGRMGVESCYNYVVSLVAVEAGAQRYPQQGSLIRNILSGGIAGQIDELVNHHNNELSHLRFLLTVSRALGYLELAISELNSANATSPYTSNLLTDPLVTDRGGRGYNIMQYLGMIRAYCQAHPRAAFREAINHVIDSLTARIWPQVREARLQEQIRILQQELRELQDRSPHGPNR